MTSQTPENPTDETNPGVTLQFFFDERDTLAGAHTVALEEDDRSEQLLLPIVGDPTRPEWRLTIGETHGLLMAWHERMNSSEGLPTGLEVDLPLDGARLAVEFPEAVPASSLPQIDLDDEVGVRVAHWSVTPGPTERALPEIFAQAAAALTNSLRGFAGLAPMLEPDFSPEGPFGPTTVTVQAVLATARKLTVEQAVASFFIWGGIQENGYRPDITFDTCETLAARTGRGAALAEAFDATRDVAVEVLGDDGPTALLQDATSMVAAATEFAGDERELLALAGQVAGGLFQHLQLMVASVVLFDIGAPDDIQPPIQSWLMALEGPGEEFLAGDDSDA